MGFRPSKIISGGQTGADRAALDAALDLGIACGGYVPKGRRAEDGRVPERYPMTECASSEYPPRTALNIRHSDATLILTSGVLDGGTLLTRSLCEKGAKPHLVVDLRASGPEAGAAMIRAFLAEARPPILNVAGPRESKAPGTYALAFAVLRAALREP